MPDSQSHASPEDQVSALFAHLVIQQTNMAMMLLGHIAHPETRERFQDFEAAQTIIDQLGMIEVKTKGNLTREEEQLLKQSLTSLRMSFVEAVNAHPGQATPATPAANPPTSVLSEPAAAHEAEGEESRKKFSKKY